MNGFNDGVYYERATQNSDALHAPRLGLRALIVATPCRGAKESPAVASHGAFVALNAWPKVPA